ncbi:MAG TPA: hypothetical protein DIS79_00570 [Bacteroidetes bacterium]|nr:hypothetical protein [Bacteroidota bacterium]HRK04119.1 T9SS type A sorting domain-containing protein [Chlorobiota bacterium]
MKHFFLAASLAAAVTGAGAQVTTTPAASTFVPFPARIVANEVVMPSHTGKSDGETQALSYTSVWSPTVNSLFVFYPNSVNDNVLHYDKNTGAIFVARTDATFDQTSGALTGGSVSVMVSTNKGQTWTQRSLLSNVNYFIGMPQLAIVGPDGSTNPDDYYYFLFGPKYTAGSGTGTVGTAILKTPGNDAYDLEFSLSSPVSSYRFFNGSDLVVDPSTLVVHQATMLASLANVEAQYGAYGVSSFSLGDEDWRFIGQPSVLALDKYRPSDGGINSSFNTPIYVDVDGEGNAYVATNNFLVGGEDRLIQVHKSDDEGTTWSNGNEMPVTILDAYAASIGANMIFQPSLTPYRGSEFVVTGPDEYSYFTRVIAGVESQATPGQLETITSYAILECKYKNNAWSISKVAELNTIAPFMFSYNDSLTQVNGENTFERSDNGRGAEIQIARSADGKLIVKYIDIDTNRRITWSPSYRLMTNSNGLWIEDGRIDTLFSQDVFIATRDMNGSAWSTPINVTNDNEFNIRTYIPRDVASVNEIPFMQATGNTTSQLTSPLNPQFAQALINTGSTPRFAMINLSTVSVAEDPAFATFHVADVRPNPATNNAEVVFTLDRPATVSVDVYDVMGNLVSTVVPATRMDAAVNGTNINVSNFAPGTYMVAVTVDGVRTARKFTVVK